MAESGVAGCPPRLRDADIRRVLLGHLNDIHGADTNTLIVQEWCVCDREARADLAVVNGTLHAFEIKAEADSLKRLEHQVGVYGQTFERATLVTCRRHLRNARAIIPRWWGIILAEESGGQIKLRRMRVDRPNRKIDSRAVSMFLWRREAIALLEANGLAKGVRSKPTRVLLDRLAEHIPTKDLTALVRQIVRAREGWQFGSRQPRCDGTSQPLSIRPHHPLPFSWLPFSQHTRQSVHHPN
jgi:hypothetical protein